MRLESADLAQDCPTRIFGFDLIRAIAISLVIISHSQFFLPVFSGKFLFSNPGFFGVELFFVLSGVLIGTILITEFESGPRLDLRLLWNFWIRRWLRTVPNYMLFLVLNLTVFGWLFESRPFDIRYFFFLQNFASPHPHLMPEAWSLAVEEWFYLTLPIAMILFTSMITHRQGAILTAIVAYILLFSGLRLHEVVTYDPPWDQGIRRVVMYRLDAIGYGVLAGYFLYYHRLTVRRYRKLLLALGGILITFSALFSMAIFAEVETFSHKTVLFTTTSAGFALMLPWFKELNVRRGAVVRLVTHISVVSYSMYLIHLSFVVPLLTLQASSVHWAVNALIYVALTMMLSTVVYKYYEKPISNLRDTTFFSASRSHLPSGRANQRRPQRSSSR